MNSDLLGFPTAISVTSFFVAPVVTESWSMRKFSGANGLGSVPFDKGGGATCSVTCLSPCSCLLGIVVSLEKSVQYVARVHHDVHHLGDARRNVFAVLMLRVVCQT